MSIHIYLPPGVQEGPAYGTDAWKDARRGLVTASRFGDVMSEPRSKKAKEAGLMSETARSYMLEIIASAVTGQDRVGGKSAAMERGVDMEADAIHAYAEARFTEVASGRLLIRDGIGATPDGFIEEDEEGPGIIEVKCPESRRHLETWMSKKVPEDYVEQVHGQIWISGRAWCDFISYDDRFPLPMRLVIIRVYRDEEIIDAIERRVGAFRDQVQSHLASIRAFLASCAPAEARTMLDGLRNHLEGIVSQPGQQYILPLEQQRSTEPATATGPSWASPMACSPEGMNGGAVPCHV